MKLLITCCLLFLCVLCNSQRLYYGGSGGLVLVNGYNAASKEMKFGANDYYISAPVGWAFSKEGNAVGFLLESQVQGTLSGSFTLSASGGLKLDISQHVGIHLLTGYADDILYMPKPFQVTHNFNPTFTARIWTGQAMLQSTYIDHAVYIGIGVIGFRR